MYSKDERLRRTFVWISDAFYLLAGYYMHIEASWYVKGAVAILEGPYMMPTSNCNMTFYYHMSGPDTGSLIIFVNSGDEVIVIFNKTGHQADNWIKGEATVKSDYALRIHITATRGDGYQGDIAIDDIKFQVQSALNFCSPWRIDLEIFGRFLSVGDLKKYLDWRKASPVKRSETLNT